ncbi:MAG: hemerythrin domain-containing protein [Rhodobacter sp.]|jgi:iron-sulfur cluster repair protein YtfE (RIC family)|nr:hemerythrin domain-containing protein [Rhodobacter sp.]
MADLSLRTRQRLPDALRVLLDEFPRTGWQTHANFGEMVQFWLQRHLMFREVLERLQSETRARIDGELAPDIYASHLSRLGGFFLQELHMHHQIEDSHYFPRLIGLDPRIDRGFELLEADHGALDGLLHSFADGANAVLGARNPHDATGALLGQLDGFAALMDRHLTDEEEIIVPVILKSGFEG